MDEKEAEARPVMGTIFLVIFILNYEGRTLVAVLPVELSYLKRIDLRPNKGFINKAETPE